MALSETLNVVTFCLGGTPAILNISMFSSDFYEKKERRREGEGEKNDKQTDLWHLR